jgi:hypothetical protein
VRPTLLKAPNLDRQRKLHLGPGRLGRVPFHTVIRVVPLLVEAADAKPVKRGAYKKREGKFDDFQQSQ